MKLLRRLVLLSLAIAVTQISVHSQTYSVLYTTGYPGPFYGSPIATEILAQGQDGNLYSATPMGGANNSGVVYKITPAGQLNVLYNFCPQYPSCTDVASVDGGLTLGTDGDFYGTAAGAGSSTFNCGVIFKITPSGSYTVLYSFTGGNDGCGPSRSYTILMGQTATIRLRHSFLAPMETSTGPLILGAATWAAVNSAGALRSR